MKINICDHCHEKMDKAVVVLKGVVIFIDGKNEYDVGEHEFCSIYCMNQYIYNGVQGRGLGQYIKV